jgi:kynureninase
MTTLDKARTLDSSDRLGKFRDEFHIPKTANGDDILYFCGHSLGLQPRKTEGYVLAELEDWRRYGVKGHVKSHKPWYSYHELVRDHAASVMGARPTEVVAMNSLTTNLHLLMVSFYQPTKAKYKILIEKHAFPSDQYAVKSQIKFHGFDPQDALIELIPTPGKMTVTAEQIAQTIDKEGDRIALIMLGGVNYLTGQAFDMKNISEIAHRKDCLVGIDLAHAAGNLHLKLHDWNIDFAAWCSYKYLNSGPGSIGGAFVHDNVAPKAKRRFEGWWGHDKSARFAMSDEFVPIGGAETWQLSNPPILPLACYQASLEIFDQAGMSNLRAKSEQLTGYLESLLRHDLGDKMELITPSDPSQRGAQLSVTFKADVDKLQSFLTAKGVICDLRKPNIMRIAPVPLYNKFEDVFRLTQLLREFFDET